MVTRSQLKLFIPVGCGLLATTAVLGSAATLGNLDVETLGTSTEVIQACQATPLSISWGAENYSPTGGSGGTPTYMQTQLTIGNIENSCQGKNYSITVAEADGTALTTESGNLANANADTINLTPSVDTILAKRVTLTIYN